MLTEDEFTSQYLQVLQKQHPAVIYHIDSTLTLTANVSGNEYKHFLDNAYREYQAEPDSLAQTFAKYALATKDLYDSDEQLSADRIVPIIKHKDFLEEAKRIGKAVVYEKYNSELIIVYGEDNEKNIKYFDKDDFTKINLTQDSLLPIALKNLDRILPKLERMGDKGNYMLVAGGDYEASLLLLTSIWTHKNFPVDGDFVVAIPNRDVLLITGSKNRKDVEALRKKAHELYESGSYQLTPSLFRWSSNGFVTYNE